MGIADSRTKLGDSFSEGARLLWRAKEQNGWSQSQLNKALGAKPGMTSRWLFGDTKPGWDWAVVLRDKLNIPLEAWTLPPSASFEPPAARSDESGPDVTTDADATGTEG